MSKPQPVHAHPTTGILLQRLFAAVDPYVEAAAHSQRQVPAQVSIVLTTGEMAVDVVHTDDDGQERIFRGIVAEAPGQAVGDALAAFLEGGLNLVSAPRKLYIARLLEEAGGTIDVVLDPVFHSATARLAVAGHAPLNLFTLQAGDLH